MTSSQGASATAAVVLATASAAGFTGTALNAAVASGTTTGNLLLLKTTGDADDVVVQVCLRTQALLRMCLCSVIVVQRHVVSTGPGHRRYPVQQRLVHYQRTDGYLDSCLGWNSAGMGRRDTSFATSFTPSCDDSCRVRPGWVVLTWFPAVSAQVNTASTITSTSTGDAAAVLVSVSATNAGITGDALSVTTASALTHHMLKLTSGATTVLSVRAPWFTLTLL